MSPEEFEYWSGQVLTARRSQLDNVRKAATAWSGLLTAVLGVFGTATFVTGLPGLDKLDNGLADGLRWAVIAIAVLLLISVISSGLASTRFPIVVNNLTADHLRQTTKDQAVLSRRLLGIAILAGGLAAILLAGGSAVLVFAQEKESGAAEVYLLTTDGGSFCGPLEAAADGITVDDQLVSGNGSLVKVAECPKE